MDKGDLIYEGKSKNLYKINGDRDYIIQTFKDTITAFNGKKSDNIPNKGYYCNNISARIFKYLETKGIPTHFILPYSGFEMIVKKLKIIPVEVVVRNVIAGSLTSRLGLPTGKPITFQFSESSEGQELPIIEYYYKSDELNDPLINEDHILAFGMTNTTILCCMKEYAKNINGFLKKYFKNIDLLLVDFKLEFGTDKNGRLMVADDINPEGCRLWDMDTDESFDKDVYRKDSGDFGAALEEVYKRINNFYK